MVYQMACCGSGYLYHRIADRGNDGGASDLFDREVEQPQRLVWLTLGLGAVERVERLQHLVPELGLVSPSTWKETELVKTVWDELTRDEEHPPNGDIIYDSSPVYDEYEEWYFWLNGCIDDLVLLGENGDVVNSVSSAVDEICDWMAKFMVKSVVFFYIEPHIMKELNVRSQLKEIASQYFTFKIPNPTINEVSVDEYTEKEYFVSVGYNQKLITGLFGGNSMVVKVTFGWGMHMLFSFAYGRAIGKHVELFKKFTILESMIERGVPFDPGGCGLIGVAKLAKKTRGRVFRRGRE